MTLAVVDRHRQPRLATASVLDACGAFVVVDRGPGIYTVVPNSAASPERPNRPGRILRSPFRSIG
jgi:hypothetical protein